MNEIERQYWLRKSKKQEANHVWLARDAIIDARINLGLRGYTPEDEEMKVLRGVIDRLARLAEEMEHGKPEETEQDRRLTREMGEDRGLQ